MNESPLGKSIAELRKAAGFTQEQLATRLGLTYQAVSKWENNQSCPDVMLLPQLADCFGVSIDALFGRENAPVPAGPTQEQEEASLSKELPWPDDETLYAVLFKGHTPLTDEPLAYAGERERIRFVYSGPALNVTSHFNITCEGCEIQGDVCAGGDVDCGDVRGTVSAGGNVDCGDVNGTVSAGGDVCARGDVNFGDVGGRSGQTVRKPHVTVHLVNDDAQPVRELKKEFDLSLSSLGEDLRELANDVKNLFKNK